MCTDWHPFSLADIVEKETGGLGFDVIVDCHSTPARVDGDEPELGMCTSRVNALAARGMWVANSAFQVEGLDAGGGGILPHAGFVDVRRCEPQLDAQRQQCDLVLVACLEPRVCQPRASHAHDGCCSRAGKTGAR